ncbi:hypothetical protein AAFF_G00249090 [Aldrovandia affinis]|uniref:Uncharacterized protein n=1 Tax=Aldrovandia affinis TaxID=143900 RepID=A0AAD7W3J0_9TELE|nr:hypothetical protein AAFF_G00249090 [Aldrovandia affinis]
MAAWRDAGKLEMADTAERARALGEIQKEARKAVADYFTPKSDAVAWWSNPRKWTKRSLALRKGSAVSASCVSPGLRKDSKGAAAVTIKHADTKSIAEADMRTAHGRGDAIGQIDSVNTRSKDTQRPIVWAVD